MAYNPEHYKANKEKYALKSKEWRLKNPDKAKANRKRNYEENKERNLKYSTEYNRKRKFGVSPEEYNALLEAQCNVCAICKQKCSRALALDHDHTTGKVRGLLCNNCNRGLGHLKDSPVLLVNALSYLLNSGASSINGETNTVLINKLCDVVSKGETGGV